MKLLAGATCRARHVGVCLVVSILAAVVTPAAGAEASSRRMVTVDARTVLVDSRRDVLDSLLHRCRVEGERAAVEHHDRGLWFASGLGAGVVLGPVGTLFAVVFAQDSDPAPQPEWIGDRRGDCRTTFVDGYRDRARSRSKWAALGGGALGTAILFTLVFAIS